ncbi:unnamed protein product [Cyclocybe aegerita]|uniref:Uncharacterized protein n=1 Tax=Cyclocybe aegerita TaxID=1973307 RepID=A0A8S0XDQ5_CYCAE|nr:unnamed protein product [Cyclocybe aegerita]
MSFLNSRSTTPTIQISRSTSEEPKPPTTDLLTFRHEKSNVFVKVPPNYENAVDTATTEFDELRNVPRDRVGFCAVYREKGQEPRTIRISAAAWPAFVSDLPRGAVIRVILRPDPDTKTPPPKYLENSDQNWLSRGLANRREAKESRKSKSPPPSRGSKQPSGTSTPGTVRRRNMAGFVFWPAK